MRNLYEFVMSPYTLKFKCPNCESDIEYLDVKIGFDERWTRQHFSCPACKSQLCVSGKYAWLVIFGTASVALGTATALMIHPWFFFVLAVIVIWYVCLIVAGAYLKALIPRKILRYYPEDLSLNLLERKK